MSSTSINSSASKLEQLTGLDGAKKLLRGLWQNNQTVHAVLLYGMPNSGKSSLAKILAQAWLCVNPQQDGACGVCKSCTAFENGNTVDLLHIEPRGASAWITLKQLIPTEDKDSPLSAKEFLRTNPLMSASKIVVLDQVDRLYHDSFNSVLKMLEEPPRYGKFILMTSKLSAVPATIRSRCLCVAVEARSVSAVSDDSVIADTPHDSKEIEIFQQVRELAQGLPHAPQSAALRIAEEFRELCDDYASATDLPARVSQSKLLEVFANSVEECHRNPVWTQAAIEAHRLVSMNCQIGIVTDQLFVSICPTK